MSSTSSSSSSSTTQQCEPSPSPPHPGSQSEIMLKQLFCGGMAGAVSKTVTAPLSRLTILFQVHSMVSSKGKEAPQYATSLRAAARKVLNREGIWAFWKGNGTSVLHRFPYSAINFYVYETAFKNLCLTSSLPSDPSTNTPDNTSSAAFRRFVAGATAGSTAVTACYPLDLIRTRLISQKPETKIHYTGITDAIVKIVKAEGLIGLYCGLGTTLCVAVPSFAISYSVYGTLKEQVLDDERFGNFRRISKAGDEKLGLIATLGCGAASGVATAILTYPLDITRRRMQVQAVYVPFEQRKSPYTIFGDLVKKEGYMGLYRGLTPELLKIVPMVGTMFFVYEQLREAFNLTGQ